MLGAWINTWLSPVFAGWSPGGVLPIVKCSLLAIHGEQDEYGTPGHPMMIAERTGVGRDHARQLLRSAPGARGLGGGAAGRLSDESFAPVMSRISERALEISL